MKLRPILRRSKRADLHLSINAIVVLILAITMLGLGLGFMRNIFGGATEEFKRVSGTVEKQLIDQMKETTKIVDINRPKVNIKIGSKDQVFLGFKNNIEQSQEFFIKEAQCTRLGANQDCTGVSIEYKQTPTEVQPGDVYVLPLNIKTDPSTAQEGTFFFDIQILIGTDVQKHVELSVDVLV